MANDTPKPAKPQFSATQKVLMAELETLRKHLFRHASNAGPEGRSDCDEGALALVRICRGLSLEDWDSLVHEMGLNQWLPLPIREADYPFLTQLQQYLEDISLQSSRDALTLLINRRAFERYLHLELQRSRREGLVLSLACLQLDNLAGVIKTHGRACADQVLLALARVLLKHKRAYDCAAHIDEDNFALLLPGVGLFEAQILLERLQKAFGAIAFGPEGEVGEICEHPEQAFSASFSAGLSNVRGPTRVTVQELMFQAEKALMEAQQSPNPNRIALARMSGEDAQSRESMVQIEEKRFLFSGCD